MTPPAVGEKILLQKEQARESGTILMGLLSNFLVLSI